MNPPKKQEDADADNPKKENRLLAVAFFKHSSDFVKFAGFATYIADGVAVAGMVAQPNMAIWFFFGLLLFLALTLLLIWRSRNDTLEAPPTQPPAPSPNPQPSANAKPKPVGTTVYIPDETALLLFTDLQVVRANLVEALKQKFGALADKKVRANIFCPTYGQPPTKYVLKIYPNLSINMPQAEVEKSQFGPNEGQTGMVFEDGTPSATFRLRGVGGNDVHGWPVKFSMTEEHERALPKDLTWILSVPLNLSGTTYGVLNFDGLEDAWIEKRLKQDAIKTLDELKFMAIQALGDRKGDIARRVATGVA